MKPGALDARREVGPRALTAGLVLAAVWSYVHNSGWGYDGLEYLVIGRAMAEGVPFYTFAPSKSFGLYYVVATYLRLPWASTHAGVSLLITAVLAMSSLAAFRVLLPRFGRASALAGAVLVAAAGVFMEQVFLLPEGPVFVSGLLAFATVTSARRPWRTWIVAGVCVGVGMAFKIVALFYALALFTWIPLDRRLAGERVWPESVRPMVGVVIGIAIALVLPAVYFGLTGRLRSHLEWTYWFPLVDYPMRSTWVFKLYTKLFWVWVVVFSAAALSLIPALRTRVYRDSRMWLLILMGVWALLPLLKSQSSHFAFPGAAFLLLFAAVVFELWAAQHARVGERLRKPVIAGLVLVCLLSAAFYWPSAIKRPFGMASYAHEEAQRASLEKLIPPDRRAIFFTRGLRFYWLSGRHPNWPILHTDIQATHLLSRRSEDMLNALDDPQLVLVEFDPRWTAYGDRRFFEHPNGRRFLDEMHTRLQRRFRRDDNVMAPLVMWIRAHEVVTE